jgi:hypothetical protein
MARRPLTGNTYKFQPFIRKLKYIFFGEVARSLSSIAGELALAVPATIVGLNDFDAAKKLDWAQLSCRWFPGVSDI